jgi:hypothetical protein
MRVRLRCPTKSCRHYCETAVDAETREVRCPACGRSSHWNTGAMPSGMLKRCPLCDCEEMFVRKNFPQRVGLLMVVAVGLVSCWLFAHGELLWSLGVLVGLVLVDLVIYALVSKIAVCYRCRAEFLDAPDDPEREGFDLATSEKYR